MPCAEMRIFAWGIFLVLKKISGRWESGLIFLLNAFTIMLKPVIDG